MRHSTRADSSLKNSGGGGNLFDSECWHEGIVADTCRQRCLIFNPQPHGNALVRYEFHASVLRGHAGCHHANLAGNRSTFVISLCAVEIVRPSSHSLVTLLQAVLTTVPRSVVASRNAHGYLYFRCWEKSGSHLNGRFSSRMTQFGF